MPPASGQRAAFHRDMKIGPELVADLAVIDVDAGADQADPRALRRRADEAEQVGEVDRRRDPLDRPERRGEVHVGGREGAGAARAGVVPFDPSLAGHAAVDERDHAEGERGEGVGLETPG